MTAQKLVNRIARKFAPYPYKPHQAKHKYLMIHIPKTAGTAVVRSLGDENKKRVHLPYFMYRNANRSLYRKCFKFAVVRNPWDRMVSIYTYLARGGNGYQDKKFQTYFEANEVSFERFLLEFMDAQRLHGFTLFKPQFSFILDEWDNVMVDFVAKQENLDTDFQHIVEKVGLSASLKKVNVSERDQYRSYYSSSALIDQVYALYKKDADFFGYEFE